MKRTIALLALAVSAAACGNGSDSPEPAATSSTPVSSPSVSSPSAEPTSALPSASPTASHSATAAPVACAGLKIAAGESQAAAGTTYTRFVITNKGSAPCTLSGRPQAQPVKDGKPIKAVKVTPIDADDPNFGAAPPPTTLAPATGTAVFFLVYGTAPVGDAPCHKPEALTFTLPGTPSHPTVPYPFTTCGGETQISAIYPSTKTL
ncbi:hypothetical protein GCM10027589_33010 [Actinocorallia lasiicapitis]